MSTITNMMGAGVAGVTGSTASDAALSKLSEKLNSSEEKNYSDEYKEKETDRLNSRLDSVSSRLAADYNSASLVTNMLGMSAANTSDLNMFFGSDLTAIKSLYSATLTVQKEARILAAEVRLDKIRGVDTSDKEAKLANLNDSVSFLDKSVTSKIDNALADKNTSSDSRSVIDKIKDDLAANQKKLDKEFGNVTDEEREAAGEEEKAEASDKASEERDARSVIDRINDGLAENQKKLDEEFSGKA